MSVVVVGLEHRRAPLDVLERVTVGEADLPKVLSSLRDRMNLQESVLLSTCLRTEVYSVVDRFHDAVSEVQELLADRAGVDVAAIEEYLSVRFDDDVPAHLFAVAAGLESAVLGESEVLGQVRRAWERAQEERVTGPVLSGLFRHAVETGKRTRSETGIGRGTTSFSHAAVELAEGHLEGGLAGAEVVVVGAGDMGEGLLEALRGRRAERRPAHVVLVNRSREHAARLLGESGDQLDARFEPIGSLAAAVGEADAVLSAVETDRPLLTAGQLGAPGARAARPLVLVDLGVPRNVDPAVGDAAGVTLFDLDDLRASVGEAMEDRRVEAGQAQVIVREQVERYRAASRARGAAPVVAALRDRLEELRTAELDRRHSELRHFSEDDWARVDALTKGVLAKLVHEPTMLLKETAGTARGERLVEALRILFDL